MLVSDVFFHYFHDPPDDEPRIMIRRIIRCSCRKSNKHDGMFCTTAKCKCSRKITNPGCNVLCACMNRTEYCYQKQQPVEDSFHDLSMQESIPDSIPESPVERNRMETSSDSSASSSVSVSTMPTEEQQSDQIADDYNDLEEVIAREPMIYSSRRLTDQQRLRLASPTSVNLKIINDDDDPAEGPHSIRFDGFGVIGLHPCFRLRRVF